MLVPLSHLVLGDLVAEGGEGRVFDVKAVRGARRLGVEPGEDGPLWLNGPFPGRLVYKQLRSPRPVSELLKVAAFPAALASEDRALAARVRAASAWPWSVVVGAEPDEAGLVALGTLMLKAPAPFWLRHRDGLPHLATLSYLAGDPDRVTVAYGVPVPPPGAPERVAVVYSLCRLLEAWQAGGAPPGARDAAATATAPPGLPIPGLPAPLPPAAQPPQAVHGDLSAKNVLWSLTPAPAVFVLDCDGASAPARTAGRAPSGVGGTEGGGSAVSGGGSPAGSEAAPARARATTPNWDDPSRGPGAAPTAATDCYSLGLAFLRVIGAAHFPIQARQREAAKVHIDLELPRSWRRLPDLPGLWDVCERSLTLVAAGERPSPGEWSAQLEDLLELMGAEALAHAARQAQDDDRPSRLRAPRRPAPARALVVASPVPDIEVRPVLRHRVVPTWQLISTRPAPGLLADAPGTRATGPGLGPREMLHRLARSWGGAHRLALRLVRSRGRRLHGLRRLAGVVVLDLAAGCMALFLVGMIVSPWIGL